MPFLLVQTKDGIIYAVDCKCLVYSIVLADMWSNNMDEIVPLKVITAGILEKVLRWAYYHVDRPPRFLKGVQLQHRRVCQWDRTYIRELDYLTLVKVNQAAGFLLMTDLWALTESALQRWNSGRCLECSSNTDSGSSSSSYE